MEISPGVTLEEIRESRESNMFEFFSDDKLGNTLELTHKKFQVD